MARAIFKDWFVDFGPTRAKAEGRAPYLAAELWDLVSRHALDDEDRPGRMVEFIRRSGWRSMILNEFNRSQSPERKHTTPYWDMAALHHGATPEDGSE